MDGAPGCRRAQRAILARFNPGWEMLDRIAEGRTDLVFECVAAGNAATATDSSGVSLLQWCSYHGDVSAIKFLLTHGASLQSLGRYYGLTTAAFHGHARLCQYLIEQGADANASDPDTGESALHAALCTSNRQRHDPLVAVLLANGANANCVTKLAVPTEGFIRDCRTKGEAPLHRAAAFGTEATIQMLLDAGAQIDARDMNGESALSWASWYARPRRALDVEKLIEACALAMLDEISLLRFARCRLAQAVAQTYRRPERLGRH